MARAPTLAERPAPPSLFRLRCPSTILAGIARERNAHEDAGSPARGGSRPAVRRKTSARLTLPLRGYAAILPRSTSSGALRESTTIAPADSRLGGGGLRGARNAARTLPRGRNERSPARKRIGWGDRIPARPAPSPASCSWAHFYAPPRHMVVNPSRHEAGSRRTWAFRVPRIPDPAYGLRRRLLPSTPVNRAWSRCDADSRLIQ